MSRKVDSTPQSTSLKPIYSLRPLKMNTHQPPSGLILDSKGNGWVAELGNITASKNRVIMKTAMPSRIVVKSALCSRHASVWNGGTVVGPPNCR